MRDLALYRSLLGVSLRAQMEYRASFLLQSLSNLLITGAEFIALWALFDRFGQLRGWSLPEVALLYGLVSVSFAIAEAMSYGFDTFGDLLKRGDFDRLLLRPRSLVLQLMGRHLALKNVGRCLQGLAVLGWALSSLDVGWTLAKAALFAAAFAGSVSLFFGVMVLQATLAFWTTESLEVMNTLTYGGVETAQFPLSIYPSWLRSFFVFVIPLGCVTWLPMLAVLGRPPPFQGAAFVLWISPLAGFVFLALALYVFTIGVRHHASTGS